MNVPANGFLHARANNSECMSKSDNKVAARHDRGRASRKRDSKIRHHLRTPSPDERGAASRHDGTGFSSANRASRPTNGDLSHACITRRLRLETRSDDEKDDVVEIREELISCAGGISRKGIIEYLREP